MTHHWIVFRIRHCDCQRIGHRRTCSSTLCITRWCTKSSCRASWIPNNNDARAACIGSYIIRTTSASAAIICTGHITCRLAACSISKCRWDITPSRTTSAIKHWASRYAAGYACTTIKRTGYSSSATTTTTMKSTTSGVTKVAISSQISVTARAAFTSLSGIKYTPSTASGCYRTKNTLTASVTTGQMVASPSCPDSHGYSGGSYIR